MNKSELTAALARRTGLSKVDAGKTVDAVTEIIGESLEAGDKVMLPGFGTFESRQRNARDGVNPATGEPLHIPAKRVVHFKVGKTLKDRIADS